MYMYTGRVDNDGDAWWQLLGRPRYVCSNTSREKLIRVRVSAD